MKNKRGQLQINFSLIFSIILIIAFIAVAFYAIKMFLGMKTCAETGMFKQDLQDKINRAWAGDETSEKFEGNLADNLDYVCFIDLSEPGRGDYAEYYEKIGKYGYVDINMFFWPVKKACKNLRAFKIEHIDAKKITESDNPFCKKNVGGKVILKIDKGFYDSLVRLS